MISLSIHVEKQLFECGYLAEIVMHIFILLMLLGFQGCEKD